MKKISLAILLILMSFQFIFAQEQSQLRKVDEFGKLGCCDLNMRTDALFNEIVATNSKAKGYILIYTNTKNVLEALRFERLIIGEIKFHSFDESRIVVIRKKTNEDLKIELWIDEKGEKPPFTTESEWNLSSIYSTKPKLFHIAYYKDGICSAFGEVKQFADILLADQNLKGHIVIFEKSQKGFLKTKKEFLDEFTKQHNIQQNQLRTFFIKIPKDSFAYNELWLVPKKKNS
jgi:hypothetical protein